MPTSTTRSRQSAVTPEDLRELTFVSDPQINPQGDRILFTQANRGKERL